MRRRRLLAAVCSLAGAAAGCSRAGSHSDAYPRAGSDTDTPAGSPSRTGEDTPSPRPATPTPTLDPGPAGGEGVGYTHLQPTGNRVLSGRGSIPDVTPTEYEAPGRPVWLVALPRGSGSVWAVATADGAVSLVTVADGTVTGDRRLATLPGGMPLVLAGEGPDVLDRPDDLARWSHPVPVGDGRLLYVDADGRVVLAGEAAGYDGGTAEREPVDALPDARIVRVAGGRYALLGGRTRRYDHGALGDSVEASTVVLADVRGSLSVGTPFELDPPAVIEGIAPIAADVTGDGARDLVVTVSDARRGARHVLLTVDGEQLAAGPEFSTGFRWRHALAVAPFGPGNGAELAAVQTPHIGGTARFHRLYEGSLEVVAAVDGVSSHALGSRTLDGGLGGDLDGDGTLELLVPTGRRDELVAIRRIEGDQGARVVWRLGLPGKLASNVTGVTLADGRLAVGAAGTDGTVRIWHP